MPAATTSNAHARLPARLAAALLAPLALLAGPAAATNGPKLTSSGVRAAGRGGVDYAFADDGTGPATNPAGMAFVYGHRLDQSWALIVPRVEWSNGLGRTRDGDLFFAVPAFSFGAFFDPSKPLEIKPLFDVGRWGLFDEPGPADPAEAGPPPTDEELLFGGRLRVGLGVFPITGGKVQLKKMRTSVFREPLDWEVDALQLAVTPSLAFRFNRWFSAGLAVQAHWSKLELDAGIAQPRFLLRDDFETAAVLLNNSPQIFTRADLDDAFTYGVSFRLGLMFQSGETSLGQLSLGLVYQERTYSADYLGRATVDANDEVNNLTQGNPGLLQLVDPSIDPSRGFTSVYDLRVQGYEQPRQVGLGLAYRPHRRFSVGLDYTWIEWHAVLSQLRVRLSGGDNPNLDRMTAPTIPVRVPMRLRNQHVVALGLSALVAEGEDLVEGVPAWGLTLRAGYNYGRSPVPRRTTLPQLPTITEHHVSCGVGFMWGPLVELSASFEWALPKEYRIGSHQGDRSLGSSTQDADILFFQVGFGLNF